MGPLIGYHTSSAGGYYNAVKHAVDYDLETFQLFLGSPRTWSYRDLKDNEAEKFKQKMKEAGFDIATVHMNYLPNPSTPESDEDMREKTHNAFLTEVKRADLIGATNLVFHIGSHKGEGFETAKPMVAKMVNEALELDPKVRLLLETSAGQKNSVGSTFEELGEIFDLITDDRVGVCFDTCHVFAAGYDLRDEKSVENTLNQFDEHVGLDRLHVVHANDSKGGLGEGKDRHAHIDQGHIKREGFKALMKQSVFDDIPFILETPSKNVKQDIKALKEIRSEIYD